MAAHPPFDLSELKDRLRYDTETGKLHWAKPKSNRLRVGQEAGTRMTNGYKKFAFYTSQVYVHHAVWYLHHGAWPQAQIDHANGDRTDNRIENLRLATQTQQNYNLCLRSDNSSGVKGVARCHRTGRWRAYLTVDRKQMFLGNHDTKEAAIAAREAAEIRYCGEFRRVSPQLQQETAP